MHKMFASILALGLSGCVPTNVPSGMMNNRDPNATQSLEDMAALAVIRGYQRTWGGTRALEIHGGEISEVFPSRTLFGGTEEGVCVKVMIRFKLLQSSPSEEKQYVQIDRAPGRLSVSHNANGNQNVRCGSAKSFRPLPQLLTAAQANGMGVQ